MINEGDGWPELPELKINLGLLPGVEILAQ